MHSQYIQTIAQITAWARAEHDIQGVIMIGSQARENRPSDQWSDLDLMVLVGDQDRWMADNAWFERFGAVACHFDEIVPLHFLTWRWCVKRVLYTDHRDVDFSILPYAQVEEVFAANEHILAKGYQVIYDTGAGALEEKLCAILQASEQETPQPLSAAALHELVSDLLFHVIWSFKKIKRGELWVALGCINCYMRGLLLQLIEAYNLAARPEPDYLQYNGRFLEQRTDAETLVALAGCFTRYDEAEAAAALQHMLAFICAAYQAICARTGTTFDAALCERIQKMVLEIKAES